MDRKKLSVLQPYELHKELLGKYLDYLKFVDARKREKRDIDVIQEHHKFVWDEDDEPPATWEQRLARKYYDKLFKEYCICDLSLYKKSKVAMRWQTESEMVGGKGQFVCGSRTCDKTKHLRTWEVNFSYMEHGDKKNTLVKLRLCTKCSNKLNYKHKKKEVKRVVTKSTKSGSKRLKSRETSYNSRSPADVQDDTSITPSKTVVEDNVWSEQLQIEDDKPREDDFEDYLEQLLF